MKKRRSLAALLCLCLLAGSLPARALDLGGLALPAYRTEELKQAVTGDYAVDPETARAYLAAIEQREREIAQLSYSLGPLETYLVDLDGDGDGELYRYDENPTPENADAGIIYGVGAIYSAEGTVLSFGGGAGSHSQPCTVYIDPPYIGVFNGEAANSMEMGHAEAVLYRYENHQLTTVNQWFFDYQELTWAQVTGTEAEAGQLTVSYTELSGQVVTRTGTAAQLEGMNLPEVDPLAQMVEGARQYGADLSNPMISSDGQGNYSAMGVNQQVKTVLQTIVDAADRGENLLSPDDAQFRDVAGVVAVWDGIFATVPFDITREETPSVEPLFDWWVDRAEGDSPYTSSLPPVASPQDPEGLTAFIESLEPQSAQLANQIRQENSWFTRIDSTDDQGLARTLKALYGAEFQPDSLYDQYNDSAFIPLRGKDGGWYCANVMVPTGGYRYDAPVSAVADLGNGLYAAYLTGLYVDPGSVYEGGYHMILQKTPQGSDLPYQILLLEEGTPTTTEVAALKNRVLDSNTQYDYEKIASFQTEKEYLDYLRERLEGLNGEPINDKGRLETAQYLQYLYENAILPSLEASRNQVVISGQRLEQAVDLLAGLRGQVQDLLDQYGVTLNRTPQVTLKVITPQMKWEERIQVEVQPDAVTALRGVDALRVVLSGDGTGFSLQPEALPDGGTLRFTISRQDGAYALVFQDESGAELPQSDTPVTLYLPAGSPLASVEAQYSGNFDNWGGQYDANSGLIFFSTQWSGIYQVAENQVELTDIGALSEEEQRIIRFMVARGFFTAPDGKFNPEGTISRYEFTTALVGMFYALDRQAECTFTDVAKDSPYYVHVASAQSSGIAEGVGNDRFDGERSVTREEVLTFCARTLVDKKGYQVPEDLSAYANFTDRETIADWALPYVALTEQLGVVDGGQALEPQQDISRAEGARLLYKLFMMLYEVSPAQAAFYEQAAQADGGFTPLSLAPFGAAGVVVALGVALFASPWGRRYTRELSGGQKSVVAALMAVLTAALLGLGVVLQML